MKNGQVALAFAGGYLFGRGHKVGWALTLAGMAAGRRLTSGHVPEAVQGLASSEIGRLREQLVSAGRSAALSAASHRMDALSDRLERRATSLRPNGHGPDRHAADDEEHERRGNGERSRGEASRGGPSRGESSRGESSRGESSRGDRTRSSGDRPERPRKRAASEGGRGGEARSSKGGRSDRSDKGDEGDR